MDKSWLRAWRISMALAAVIPAFIVASVLVASIGFGGAGAQEHTATPVPEEETATPSGEPESRQDRFLSTLAGKLGVSVEELEQAIRDTNLELLDEAVADGRISEEDAARIRERIESGEALFFPHPRPHRAPGWGLKSEVAEFLGITREELFEARMDGQTLAEIAAAEGVSEDDLAAYLIGEIEEYVNEALEAGRISQERADELLAGASARVDELIHSEGLPHRFGPGRGPRPGLAPFVPDGAEEAVPDGAGLTL
jgi:uncharacterized protein YidB (DUF937 family)